MHIMKSYTDMGICRCVFICYMLYICTWTHTYICYQAEEAVEQTFELPVILVAKMLMRRRSIV